MSWPVVKFGEVATIVTGSTPKKVEGNYDGDIPFVTPGDLGAHAEISYSNSTVTEQGAKSGRLLPKGAVLVCCIGATIGKVGIADCELITNQQINSLVFDESKVFPKFGYYFCTSIKPLLIARSSSTTMPIVNKSNFSKFEMPLPPLDEQKRIAAILDKADSVRRKRQQAIDLADDFLRSVFLEMFGDPVTNPKGWEVKPLSELIDKGDKLNYGVVQPGDNVDDGVPLIRSGDLGDTGTDLNKIRKVSTLIDEKHKKSRLKGNEILIACVGSIGKVGWVNESMIGWNIARAVTRIPLSNDVNREYVYRYLQSPVIQGYFQRETRAVAQPTLNVGLIGKTPIALPPLELQEEFLKIFSNVVSIKRKYSENGTRDSELFNVISQKAFAGEL
ncbi:restriction endonuclease subunit S [Pseudoalteromonas phenolica]|uniref:restriction endonuclease subunit S n=1 Tax=Pseudoalteromonas phenolica TaxID=161398 RepID=UPI00384E97BB